MKKTIAATCKGGMLGIGVILLALAGTNVHAQDASAAQRETLGQVSGSDVTVTGPASAPAETSGSGSPNMFSVADGSTIVVHSGKARLDFTGGGEADICGPAKLTVLDSGEALTIALSFGHVHVKIDALRPIMIYTPTILATPISIQEQPREMTLGISNSGAMCVAATHGAVQVQQQLSGETLVIPEPSTVELRDAPFGARPATAGTCTCDFGETVAQRATTSAITAARNQTTGSSPKTSVVSTPAKTIEPPAAKTAVTSASKSAQQSTSPRREAGVYTASNPTLKASYLSIGDDTESATVSAVPLSVATLILAKEADVETGWTFHGDVIGPPQALAHRTAKSQKKRGFWSHLRAFFFGSKS
ncbi:MAG TPA: hypothetical protein VGR81_12000 [Candidatus Acidoferrales bacterium]|nr:hypothetical protein [Candidatus Acidoferrales bacterium]